MSAGPTTDPIVEVDAYVAAFEAARGRGAAVDPAAFLPVPDHPLYREVLLELVRVDLELGWAAGAPRDVDDYRARFPHLFADPRATELVAFEEHRLRLQAGEVPGKPPANGEAAPACFPAVGAEFLGFRVVGELGRGSFARVYLARQGELADRPVVLKVCRDVRGESRTLARLQHTNIVPVHSVHRAGGLSAICMPFLGSVTLAEVIRRTRENGALPATGRALADTLRTGRGATRPGGPEEPEPGEAQPHADVPSADGSVPVLASLEGLSYVEAVLWIGARLADGLAHAHARGILHLDLKPANVLLADDGQPMLLDFNLSRDVAPGALPGSVGGTVPYMAPEHLRALRDRTSEVDGRCDVYALGVILYELLTGRHPFPTRPGPAAGAVARAIEGRSRTPTPVQSRNPAATPAVDTIVRHCLEPAQDRRYSSAAALRDDLDRQLHHLPLRHARESSLRERARKWARRHPRLTSATGVGILAGLLLMLLGGLLVVRGERLTGLEAAAAYDRFRAEVREAHTSFVDAPTGRAQPSAIRAACRKPLDRYRVLDDSGWQDADRVRRLPPEVRDRLRAEIGDLLFLLAALDRLQADNDPACREVLLGSARENLARAESCYPTGQAPAALVHLRTLQTGSEAPPTGSWDTVRDGCALACLLMSQGRFREARPLWERATRVQPQTVWAWCGLGGCDEALGRHADAAASYGACIALHPDHHGWYVRRGLARLRADDVDAAAADFDRALELRPGSAEAHVNRGSPGSGRDGRWKPSRISHGRSSSGPTTPGST